MLPGSKSTIGDLAFLRAQGWDIDIKAHVRRGGHVLGLCGGYQMLGRTIADPDGVDGRAGTRRRPWAARRRNRHERGQVDHAGPRHALRDRRRDQRLRNPSRPQRGRRLRAAAADDRWPARRREFGRRPRCRAPMCTGCSPATPFAGPGWHSSASRRRWPTRPGSSPRSTRWPIISRRISTSSACSKIARSRQTTSASAA